MKPVTTHILPTSATMIGACLTVITFFQLGKMEGDTFADEILAIATLVFIASAFASYMSLRANSKKLELVADRLFLIGLCIMVLVGLLIVIVS